jgi:hypothetical protein
MNGKDITDERARLPAQAQQPQPTLDSADALVALQDAPETGLDGSGAGIAGAGETAPDAALDARLTAGVVELYAALLKEPIPEEMLRLVEKLSKQERK